METITFKILRKIKFYLRFINSTKFFYYLLLYNSKKDISINEKNFSELNLNLNLIKNELHKYRLDYYDPNLSWHYHIFASLKKNQIKKILEIGTFDGKLANFLSKVFRNGIIYTLDLPNSDNNYLLSYNRSNSYIFNKIEKRKKKNLKKKNIKFYQIDSKHIVNLFKKNSFDLIWIDGDHLDPQVSLDILNSYNILKKGGIMCCDDIVMENIKNSYLSNESFKTLEKLKKQKKILIKYFVKRINYTNLNLKKYIAYCKKI